MSLFYKFVRSVSNERQFDGLYQLTCQLLREVFNTEYACLVLRSGENEKTLIPHDLSGSDDGTDISETLVLSQHIMAAKKAVSFSGQEILQKRDIKERGSGFPVSAAWLGAPLMSGSNPIGTLSVSRRNQGQPFTSQDEKLLEMICLHVAGALERRESDEHLAEQGQILQQIIDTSPVGIALVQNRVFKWVNNRMVIMFGYETKADFQNNSVRMIYCSQKDYELAGKLIFYGLTATGKANYEIDLVRKDGSRFPAHIRLNSREESDPMAWTIATISDTSRRKATEKIKAEKEKLKGVLEIAESVCHQVDLPLQKISEYVNRNQAGKSLSGQEVEDLRKQALKIGEITKKLTDITRSGNPVSDNVIR